MLRIGCPLVAARLLAAGRGRYAPQSDKEGSAIPRRTNPDLRATLTRLVSHWPHVAAFLGFLALTVLVALPQRGELGRRIVGDTGDPSLYMWTWRWEAHALAGGNFSDFWRGTFFYPNRYAVAYTEHILPVMPLYALYEWVTGSSILAYNLVYVSLFVLAGICGYALCYSLTRSYVPAFVGGVAFGFSPFRMAQVTHLHISTAFATALAFLVLRRMLTRSSEDGKRVLWGLGLALGGIWALQTLMSYYLGAILAIGLGAYALVALVQQPRPAIVRALAVTVSGLVFGLLLIAPFTWPYFAARQEIHQERDESELVLYSVRPRAFFQPHFKSFLYSRIPAPAGSNDLWETQAFFGVALTALVVTGLAARRENALSDPVDGDRVDDTFEESDSGEDRDAGGSTRLGRRLREALWDERARWIGVAASGAVMALGPRIQVRGIGIDWPNPFFKIFQLFPGVKGFRVPGRFSVLMYLGLAVLAACGARALWRRGIVGRVGVGVLTAVMIAEFSIALPVSVEMYSTSDPIPPVNEFLRDAPPGAVIELPIYREGVTAAQREAYRIYVATLDWQPRVNGYSGYYPHGYKEMVEVMRGFPDAESVRVLRDLGVGYVVVHSNEFDEPGEGNEGLPSSTEVLEKASRDPALRLVAVMPPAYVYEVVPPDHGE